jgi:hypothetical protein
MCLLIGLMSNIGGRNGASSSRKNGGRSKLVGPASNGSAVGGFGAVDIVLIFSPFTQRGPTIYRPATPETL